MGAFFIQEPEPNICHTHAGAIEILRLVLDSPIPLTGTGRPHGGDMSGRDRREQPTTPSSADIESQAGKKLSVVVSQGRFLQSLNPHPRSDWTYRVLVKGKDLIVTLLAMGKIGLW